MRQGARLPEDLWREIYGTAIYLHNRTPRYLYNWKTPYKRFHTYIAHHDGIVSKDRKPYIDHLRVYGCKTFAMTTQVQRKSNRPHKLDPRAFVGYLVGYRSTNIFRAWNPLLGKVISTRDEVFPGSDEELKGGFLRVKNTETSALLEKVEEQEPQRETKGKTQ